MSSSEKFINKPLPDAVDKSLSLPNEVKDNLRLQLGNRFPTELIKVPTSEGLTQVRILLGMPRLYSSYEPSLKKCVGFFVGGGNDEVNLGFRLVPRRDTFQLFGYEEGEGWTVDTLNIEPGYLRRIMEEEQSKKSGTQCPFIVTLGLIGSEPTELSSWIIAEAVKIRGEYLNDGRSYQYYLGIRPIGSHSDLPASEEYEVRVGALQLVVGIA